MSSEIDEQSFKDHVNSSIMLFSIVTLVFFIMRTVALYSGVDGSDDNKSKTLRNVSTFAFMAIFFLFSYFTNLSATEEKIICGEKNHRVAFYATVIPFILIYSVGIFLISIFPGWIRCFSNTIGSSFLNFSGVESETVNNLKSVNNQEKSNEVTELSKLYSDNPQILLNEIHFDDSGGYSELFKRVGIIVDDNNILLIKKYIFLKESIGEGVWHAILSIITILVGYNTILAENCNAFSVNKDDFRKSLNDKFQKN